MMLGIQMEGRNFLSIRYEGISDRIYPGKKMQQLQSMRRLAPAHACNAHNESNVIVHPFHAQVCLEASKKGVSNISSIEEAEEV